MESYRRRDNLDYLIGQKVKHTILGKGEIIQVLNDTLYIKFNGETVLRKFPMDSYINPQYFERKAN